MRLSLERSATAVVRNGLGWYQEAFAAASEALQQDPTELWFSPWATVELIERLTCCGARRCAVRDQASRRPGTATATPAGQGGSWTVKGTGYGRRVYEIAGEAESHPACAGLSR